MSGYKPTFRDKVAYRVCNYVMRFATPQYRALIKLGHVKAHQEIMKQIEFEKVSQTPRQK